jgi:hypothetical protein
VVISTGKSDWERSVTNETGSLASYISNIEKAAPLTITGGGGASTPGTAPSTPIALTSHLLPTAVAGIFKDSENHAVSILNGSHDTLSRYNDNETVLVFPDYKILTEVPRSLDGARELWRNSVCPSVSRLGSSSATGSVKSWVIPYTCVILICERLFFYTPTHVCASVLRCFANFGTERQVPLYSQVRTEGEMSDARLWHPNSSMVSFFFLLFSYSTRRSHVTILPFIHRRCHRHRHRRRPFHSLSLLANFAR